MNYPAGMECLAQNWRIAWILVTIYRTGESGVGFLFVEADDLRRGGFGKDAMLMRCSSRQ